MIQGWVARSCLSPSKVYEDKTTLMARSEHVLTDLQKAIINRLQLDIPMVSNPFEVIAEELDISESELLLQIEVLKREHLIIRQLSAIFDTRNLGYQSTLVAFKVDPDKVMEAARVINRHPGVSHNYLRDHVFNIWFTLAIPAEVSLEDSVELLRERSGADKALILPTLKMYKIAVRLDMSDGKDQDFVEAQKKITHKEGVKFVATPLDIEAIRQLQQDLPLVSRPFEGYANAIGISEDELFELANGYKATGVMRRFSAVLRHRKAGFGHNVMGVWQVPEDRWDEVGHIMAQGPSISHCYRRPTYPEWPYTHFTMIHGKDLAECQRTLDWIQEHTGIQTFASLTSLKEFKKIRLKYYTPELDDWNPSLLLTGSST